MTSAKITLLSMLAAQSDKKTPSHHPLLMKVIIACFHFRLSVFRLAAEPSVRLTAAAVWRPRPDVAVATRRPKCWSARTCGAHQHYGNWGLTLWLRLSGHGAETKILVMK